jgi:hypothetical protein
MKCHATQVATWRLLGDRQLCAVLLQCELSKDGYSYRNKFLNWQWYFSLCGATITCGRLVRSCSISQLPQLRSFATPPHLTAAHLNCQLDYIYTTPSLKHAHAVLQ